MDINQEQLSNLTSFQFFQIVLTVLVLLENAANGQFLQEYLMLYSKYGAAVDPVQEFVAVNKVAAPVQAAMVLRV